MPLANARLVHPVNGGQVERACHVQWANMQMILGACSYISIYLHIYISIVYNIYICIYLSISNSNSISIYIYIHIHIYIYTYSCTHAHAAHCRASRVRRERTNRCAAKPAAWPVIAAHSTVRLVLTRRVTANPVRQDFFVQLPQAR
jgi:hypothetical protein